MKRMLMIAAVLAVAVFSVIKVPTTGARTQEPQSTDNGLPNKIWKRGLAIAPVALNLDGKDKTLVGEGSYIVNGSGICSDCHTQPNFKIGGNPFLGQPEQANTEHYLAGGRRFMGGTIISRNLTPDLESGLPAGLTFEQFVEVMRTGKDFDNLHPQISPLLQVMTWPWYSKMTDRDLSAIYEYLRAVPHAEP